MENLRANRFAVLSRHLVVRRLEDMDFTNAWIRMKGNLAPVGSTPTA
jgi:hypothetical protein